MATFLLWVGTVLVSISALSAMLQTLHWLLEATQFKVNEFQLQPWWILAPSIASLAAFVGAVAAKYISTLS